jgi:hypothetical protein
VAIAKQERENHPPKLATRKVPGVAILLGLALLLAPSGWFAWKFRSMPQLGAYHDDAVLWLSAQSLAGNHGYAIPQLPENPAQTRYPPLYPLLLSLVSRGSFSFAAALQWSFYAPYLILAWLFFRRCGFSPPAAYGLTSILALCPITIILGTAPLTELPFSVVLLGLMLLLDGKHSQARSGLLAGALAAAAFLIRTNSIVLAVSVPLLLIRRRSGRFVVTFLTPLAAAIAGWQVWCLRNATPAKDDLAAYYTSYLGFYLRTFSFSDFPHRIWVNFASIVEALPRLVFFSVGESNGSRMLGWLLTATAVAGVVMLFRGGIRHYPAFAALSVVLLVLWEYPSDTRFVFPLFPLYVAGAATKLREVAALAVTTWREKRGPDRVLAAVILSILVLAATASTGLALRGIFNTLPDYFADREQQRAEMLPVYTWIAAHTSAGDRFAAYDDTLLYLNAGRRGYTVPILPRLVYNPDPVAVRQFVSGLREFWRAKRVAYVLVTKYDFRRDLHAGALDSLRDVVGEGSRFEQIYSDPAARVYRVLEAGTP